MRETKLIRVLWAMLFLLPYEIRAQNISEPERIQDRPSFYDETDPGEIAFLPDCNQPGDAKYMTSFWALQKNGCYEIPRRKNYGFVANIRNKSNARKKPSFLAVTVIQIQDAKNTSGAWIALTRTENFVRENDATFKEDPKEFQHANVTLSDLRNWHTRLKSMSDFDLALQRQTTRNFSWHAKPLNGSTSSWDFRSELFGPLSDKDLPSLLTVWFPDLPQDYKVRIETHLLRFTPAEGRVPEQPLDFYFNNCGARRAIIITTCPDYPSYASFVLLKLKS